MTPSTAAGREVAYDPAGRLLDDELARPMGEDPGPGSDRPRAAFLAPDPHDPVNGIMTRLNVEEAVPAWEHAAATLPPDEAAALWADPALKRERDSLYRYVHYHPAVMGRMRAARETVAMRGRRD